MNLKEYNFPLKIVLLSSFLLIISLSSFGQLSQNEKETLKKLVDKAESQLSNNKTKNAAKTYYKAGLFCFEKKSEQEAIKYLNNAAKLYGKAKDIKKVMKIYSNIGLIYSNLDDSDNALKYFKQSLKIRTGFGTQKDLASGLLDMGYIHSYRKDYKEAIINILKALDIANKIQDPKLILTSYNMLAENYQKNGNMQKAAEYMDKFATYRQYYEKTQSKEKVSKERIKSAAEISMKEAENRAKQLELELTKRESKFAEEKLQREIKVQQDSLFIAEAKIAIEKAKSEKAEKNRLLAEAETEIEKNKTRLIITITTGFILLAFAITLGLILNIRRKKKHNRQLQETNEKIEKQKRDITHKNNELKLAFDKIEEQNNDINASINYAVNIQKSMLSGEEALLQLIPESFILFKPRDKVSGDYYWFKNVLINPDKDNQQQKIFVSAIDCTGHGVPGALLSMISYNLLDRIIEQQKIYDPGKILDELHNGIRKTLRQKETANRDGMDMAICSYDPDKNLLEFSGAKNPMIYIKDNKLHRVKGSIKPIGGMLYERNEIIRFSTTTIEIDKPTTVYIFSDGYADQLGEKTGRKLMSKSFRNLLKEIHEKPLPEQRKFLDDFMTKWKGEIEQVDDIIIIGFKLYPK